MEKNPTKLCPKCQKALVRSSAYDPDGMKPLTGGIRVPDEWWVCINPDCGRRNCEPPDGVPVLA